VATHARRDLDGERPSEGRGGPEAGNRARWTHDAMQCHDVVREGEDGAHEGAPGGARAQGMAR
jgi:hypothetical protein